MNTFLLSDSVGQKAGRRAGRGAWLSALLFGSLVSLAGCPKDPEIHTRPEPGSPATATATIEARSNSTVTGSATFEQTGNKVKVTVEVSGATPGQHGLHIHEKGDCSDPAAKSAGDHFNPGQMEHGGLDKPMHHAGDFGNLTVGEDGKGRLEIETDAISLAPGPTAVLNRAIVVHEKPDDMTTQPSGNSGARIGCGAILPKK
jgi:Cu-Zn family superoxide dismutase